ncbi:MAG: mechanosensitive ion channel family protein [Microbacteriaceae bacterium]
MDWAAFWAWIHVFITDFKVPLVVAAVIVGFFLLRWILKGVINRSVDHIVTGVKKRQNVDDTQALVTSPLAAVRVVQRTRTLGSVLNSIVTVALSIIGLVLIVNTIDKSVIGSLSLLTAAIGAGLGFGAQRIVNDVLNGLFMVMEDQLGVGDVVDLGEATGMVEAVGIRITQVRDVNGTLWSVRNGEILRIGNMSQGWARVILDLAVPYETDIELVQSTVLATATELAQDPKWRSNILERPESWGLESIADSALVIRLVTKTRSAAKDDVARELRMRVKRALDERGIVLPSLKSVVLSGFDGAASIKGARPPRTRPVPVAKAPPTRGKK